MSRHQRMKRSLRSQARGARLRKRSRRLVRNAISGGLIDWEEIPELAIERWRSDPRWTPPLGIATEEDRLALARSTQTGGAEVTTP